jgi:hypothetical protein
MDFNRSQREFTIEVSPLHVLVSELRLEALTGASRQLACFSSNESRSEKSEVPRLEILSGLMVQSIDLSLKGLQVSLLSSEKTAESQSYEYKNTVLTHSLTVFLQTVSK